MRIKIIFLIFLIIGFWGLTQVSAAGVELLWEGKTTVPTFYLGRPLPSAGNEVRVVAMPNIIQDGQRLDLDQLYFRWTKDSNSIQTFSGRGKNFLDYQSDPQGTSSVIGVRIFDLKNNLLANSESRISPALPKVILYLDKPGGNPISKKALGKSIQIESGETTFFAQPFFFSPSDLEAKQLVFDWRVNGEKVATPKEDPRFFSIQTNGEVNEANLSISITSSNSDRRQTAKSESKLSFNKGGFLNNF